MHGQRWFIILAVSLAALAAVASHAENEPQPAPTPSAATKEPAPPPSVTIIAPRKPMACSDAMSGARRIKTWDASSM